MSFSDMVKSGYFMYMAEAEGLDYLVNTREAKLNAVARELPYNPSFAQIEAACLRHGLNSISQEEYNFLTHR